MLSLGLLLTRITQLKGVKMFKVGDKVIDTDLRLGEGIISEIDETALCYPIVVQYNNDYNASYTLDGRRWSDEDIVLQLVEPLKEFNVGDKVYHPDYGEGKVILTNRPMHYQIQVEFGSTKDEFLEWVNFTREGRMFEKGEITLRHLENEE